MKKLFKWLVLLIAVLAVGLIVILYNPDLLKGPLERKLSDLSGHSITLGDELDVDIGGSIEVSANNIVVSSPDWTKHQELLAVGQLKLKLETASLFKDTVVIEFLQLDELQLNLETDSEGAGNWLTKTDKTPKPDDNQGGGSVVVFKAIQAGNATFRFNNGKTGVENVFGVDTLSHEHKADGMLHTTLNGNLNNRLVEYTGSIGPYENLLNGRDISFDTIGHFGELTLKGNGFIDNALKPHHPKFNLDLQGPDIDEITDMLGVNDLGGGGFSLRAKGGPVNGNYEADINGRVGDVSLGASAQASDISQLNELDLDVAINGPNLGSFTRVFGIENWPDKPFSLNGSAERVGQTLNVRDITLNVGGTKLLLDALFTEFPALDASRIKLSISGDEIAQFHELVGMKGLATGPFSVTGNLDVSTDGVELLRVGVDTSLGNAKVSGTLGPAPDYIDTRLDVHLDGSNANSVMLAFGIDLLPEKPFNLNTHLEVVDKGLLIERGVLVTIENERLELGGKVAFVPGSIGTSIDLKLSGQHLARVIRRHVGDLEIPDRPYELSGQVQVSDAGIELENMVFDYEAISLKTDGLIKLEDQLSGSALDFQINGDNLSTLRNFKAIGSSLDILVPGQPYQLAGRIKVETGAWKLDSVNGHIGETSLNVDALISKQPGLAGSNLLFSVSGPDLNKLLLKKGDPGLPIGNFESSARVELKPAMLSLHDFKLKTVNANAEADIDLGWPLSKNTNINFNVDVQGEDIRNLVPATGLFDAEAAAFQVNAVGNTQGNLLVVDQFESKIGNLSVSLKGKTDDQANTDEFEVTFNVSSEDLSKFGRLKGKPLPALPLAITADFKGNTKQLAFRNLVGSLGDSKLKGEFNASLGGPKPGFELIASSDYIDIRPFLNPDEAVDEAGDDAVDANKPDRLIPATPLPLEALEAVDLKINLDIAEVRYHQDNISDLILDLELNGGKLNLSQLSYIAPRGKLSASMSLIPITGQKADVIVDLNTERFVINLSGLEEDRLDHVPAFDIDFHGSGKGGNLQELAGSLNGSFYISSEGGSAENIDLSFLDTFIMDEIFSTIMPKSDAEVGTQLSCIAANLKITDGLIKTRPAVAFTSEKIAIVTKGTLDLKTEKMAMNFNSTPTNALQINPGELFYPYVLITGTLAAPKVGVDPGKAVLHGGAAIATMGISVLAKGVLDRAGNAMPVCERMVKDGPGAN